jgi:hypothetical protein
MSNPYDEFMADLINEREKTLTECDNNLIAESIYDNNKDAIKNEDVECCVCLISRRGMQLSNCEHFVCSRCHYKMQHGFISEEFYNTHRRPFCGPEKPEYPYKDACENTEIYKTLADGEWYKDWFVNNNEDLYNCIKQEEEFIKYIPYDKHKNNIQSLNNIKQWFETNEKMQQYETELVKFYNEYKLFEEKNNLYEKLCQEEMKNNCIKTCPLCSR